MLIILCSFIFFLLHSERFNPFSYGKLYCDNFFYLFMVAVLTSFHMENLDFICSVIFIYQDQTK